MKLTESERRAIEATAREPVLARVREIEENLRSLIRKIDSGTLVQQAVSYGLTEILFRLIKISEIDGGQIEDEHQHPGNTGV